MGAVNSHVQLTKSLLRNFSHKTDEGEKVYYLDLSDSKIKEEKIKKLGTVYGYYSEDVEKFLSEEVENKIGDVAKRFKDFSKQKREQLTITSQNQDSIKMFFKYSLIRSKYIIREVNKASYFAEFLGGYTTNHIISFSDDRVLDDFFENYEVDILLNNSNVEFVIPRNCFYSGMVTGKPTKYILPINPRTAFVLIHKNELNCYIIDGKHYYPQINDDAVANSFNKRALFDEQHFNNTFVKLSEKKNWKICKIIFPHNYK